MERALTIVLAIITAGLAGYIIYDKFLRKIIEKEEKVTEIPAQAPVVLPITTEAPRVSIVDISARYE